MGRSGWLVGGLLWLAALGIRLLYVEQSQTSPFFDYPLVDAKTYADAAERMGVLGHWDGGDAPFWQPPLYPYFLGISLRALHSWLLPAPPRPSRH